MDGGVNERAPKPPSEEDAKIVRDARERMRQAMEALDTSRQSELDDLRFRAGSPDNNWQWPADILANRVGTNGQAVNARPTLTVNKLPQHVLQVTNDQRKNRPAGKTIPVDDKGDVEVAEVFDGVIRHIEYISDADVATDTACDNQVTFGEGYFRILTKYCNEKTFDQDLIIGRIRNSFSVYMDPTIQDPCGSDAKWCIITEQLSKDEFERSYPNATPIGSIERGVGDDPMQNWINDKGVTVAEYFYFESEVKTLCAFFDGQQDIYIIKGTAQYDIALAKGLKPMRERDTQIKRVKWCKTNGYEILETNDWRGKWIPVIRVVGNEFEVEGKLHVSGIVRNAKDAQRMYNYWVSQEAEMLALAPKAPFVGYAGQFDGYEDHWKTANTQNWPYLEVNPDAGDPDGKAYPLPQRAMPPMPQTAIIQAKLGAGDDIKGTTGQYDPSLGQKSNETSGKAILAREDQSDTGTYHYGDNLRRAIRFRDRQLIDLIPKIYDTTRIARIIGIDGEPDHVKIDPNMQQPYMEKKDQNGAIIDKIYNLQIGTYDVVATTGPSYASKRQQAAEAQAQLLQANPDLWKVAGDLFVKNLDWPGADELSKRLAKLVPPELKDDDESPELAQANQVIKQQQQAMQQMTSMLQNVQKSIEAQDVKNADIANQIKAYDAETKRISSVQEQMKPEQIQDIILGTLHGMMTSGELQGAISAPVQPQQAGIQ